MSEGSRDLLFSHKKLDYRQMLALAQQPQDYISAISELVHAGYLMVTKGLLWLQAPSLLPEQRGSGGGNC